MNMFDVRWWSVIVLVAGCASPAVKPAESTAAVGTAGAPGSSANSTVVAPSASASAAAVAPSASASAPRYVRPSDAELRKRLTPNQYKITQEGWTEPPYRNAYWNNEEPGLYVDIVTGQPLFISLDKYDSHTGWASFTKPLAPELVFERPDHKLTYVRREVVSVLGNSHLGHIFEDGPKPSGLRYCINSLALRFIPVDELEAQGYGEYKSRFGTAP